MTACRKLASAASRRSWSSFCASGLQALRRGERRQGTHRVRTAHQMHGCGRGPGGPGGPNAAGPHPGAPRHAYDRKRGAKPPRLDAIRRPRLGDNAMTNRDGDRAILTALRRRALVVEGEQAVRDQVRIHLARAGFDIDEIGEGSAAIERTRGDRAPPAPGSGQHERQGARGACSARTRVQRSRVGAVSQETLRRLCHVEGKARDQMLVAARRGVRSPRVKHGGHIVDAAAHRDQSVTISSGSPSSCSAGMAVTCRPSE